jgi:hypothetical protein
MSDASSVEGWYGSDRTQFELLKARGALLDGARRIVRGEHYAAYTSLLRAEAGVDDLEARRIRGLVHAAVAGVKATAGDVRGAERQLERARTRLGQGAPTLAEFDVNEVLGAIERFVAVERARAEEPRSEA